MEIVNSYGIFLSATLHLFEVSRNISGITPYFLKKTLRNDAKLFIKYGGQNIER